MAITWISPVTITNSAAAWEDHDVSANVPATAKGVILHYNTDVSRTITFRKNGSTDSRTAKLVPVAHGWATVGLDSSRIFEMFVSDITNAYAHLVGYFEDEAVFFTNAIDKTPTTDGTNYYDVDISSNTGADISIGAFFETFGSNFFIRKNGSTDDFYRSTQLCWAQVGVDAAEICEYRADAANSLFLQGYITGGAVFNTNATDYSLVDINDWVDLAALPADATGGFFIVFSVSTVINYGLRTNGQTEGSFLNRTIFERWAIIEADGSGLIEGQISITNVDFYLTGYATSPTVSPTAVSISITVPDALVINDLVTPTPVVLTAALPEPAFVNDLVTPTPATVTITAVAPTVVIGAVTVTASPVAVAVTAVAPKVVLTISPAANVINITVATSTIRLTQYAAPSVITLAMPPPTIILTQFPDPVAITASVISPTIILTQYPDPVAITVSVISPTIIMTQHPDPATISITIAAPTNNQRIPYIKRFTVVIGR